MHVPKSVNEHPCLMAYHRCLRCPPHHLGINLSWHSLRPPVVSTFHTRRSALCHRWGAALRLDAVSWCKSTTTHPLALNRHYRDITPAGRQWRCDLGGTARALRCSCPDGCDCSVVGRC